MYQAIYIEINALCILILCMILFRIKADIDKQAVNIAFFRVVLAVIAFLLTDIAWILVEVQTSSAYIGLNKAINCCYLFQTGAISYLWVLYVECRLGKGKKLGRTASFLISLPIWALLALCVLSIWTGSLFTIGAGNAYHRGPLYLIQPLVSYSYLLAASIRVAIRMLQTKSRQERGPLGTLLSFAILPALGGVISVAVYGLPTVGPAITFALLMVFINYQSNQISTDGLTKVNNRRQFDAFLGLTLTDSRRSSPLYLYLLDIDSFKRINDTFGHPEGDQALIRAAAILRDVCMGKEAFLARFGGDEFAIVYRCNGPRDAEALKNEITQGFLARQQAGPQKYILSISIGYALYEEGATAEALVAQADQALYQAKQAHTAGCAG